MADIGVCGTPVEGVGGKESGDIGVVGDISALISSIGGLLKNSVIDDTKEESKSSPPFLN